MEVLLRSLYGATAVICGATAVPRRCHGGHGGAAATPPRFGPTRDDTAEVLNMLKVSAVPPRRSAVLTVFGGATTINDETTAELRRSWRWHCGSCRTSTAVAPRIRCDGGIITVQTNVFPTELIFTRQLLVFVVSRTLSLFRHTIKDDGCELVKCAIQREMRGKRRRMDRERKRILTS